MQLGSNSECAQQTARILVVDDSPTFLRVISGMLEEAGYTVETAASGEVAFERCFGEAFDLVVSDITMGALSGVQLCRLLRSDPATKDIPVVLLTAADDPRSRFWAQHAGAAAYVAKERTRLELLPEMARVLHAAPCSVLPLKARASRRAQPMERLAQVLDDLLFRAVVSSEARKLADYTHDRRQFGTAFLRTAAAVAHYSYLVLKLHGPEHVTCSVHARAAWPDHITEHTREVLELPQDQGMNLDVLRDGPSVEHLNGAFVCADKARFVVEAGGEALGSLVAVGTDKRLGGTDRITLELLARELGLLVKNVFLLEETQRLANSDGLTGLQNRRRAAERLELEVERAQRYQTRLSVLLCDVDHFKQVNDTFGHNAGDEVLVRVARMLHESVRQVDLVARWGGEEFLVLLPDTDVEGARIVAERIRCAVAELPAVRPELVRVTCSVGGTHFAPGDTGAIFVERADQALYRAKRTGRNRVEFG